MSAPEATFVGRARELARLQELWLSGVRALTLLGPGGAGKSRLAAEALSRSHHWGWARSISLAGAHSEAAINGVVAEAFGWWSRSAVVDEPRVVGAALAERGPGTLCLDEAEGCVEVLRGLLPVWLQEAPELRVLVTSRRRLGQRDEALVEVGGLDPEDGFLLYRLRAALKVPGWELSPAERPALQSLLDRVSNLPLGIELAAAQAGTRTLAELLVGLDRGEEVLADPEGPENPRHRSLDRCVASSFRALEPHLERAVLALSVFREPFDLELAAVALDRPDPERVQVVLTGLYDRSLLLVQREEGRIRFRTYEPVRELASSRLSASGEREAVERRVSTHLAEIGARAAIELHEGAGREAAKLLRSRREDLRWAFWASLPRWPELAMGLALALDGALLAAGPVGIHEEVLQAALFAAREHHLVGAEIDLLRVRARADFLRGRHREAQALIEKARLLAEAHGDRRRQREVRLLESAIVREFGQAAVGERLAELSLLECQEADDPRGAVRALHNRAAARADLGQGPAAHRDYAEALALAQVRGCHRIEALCLVNLGILARKEGQLEIAAARTEQGCQAFLALGETLMAGKCMVFAARIAEEQGRVAEADALEAQALASLQVTQDVSTEIELRLCQGLRAERCGQWSTARLCYEDVWASARHFAIPELIEEAELRLAQLERRPRQQGDVWSVGGGAYWFQRPGVERVELGRRPSLRRILAHLVDRRLTAPGHPATVVELVAVGWPGEQPTAESGAERVYTAIRTLRAFGLRDLLRQQDGGYLLDPTVSLERRE